LRGLPEHASFAVALERGGSDDAEVRASPSRSICGLTPTLAGLMALDQDLDATASQAAPEPPCPPSTLGGSYKAAVEAAGADLGHLDLRDLHDLRHTFATWAE
jgi:hypothetical protein